MSHGLGPRSVYDAMVANILSKRVSEILAAMESYMIHNMEECYVVSISQFGGKIVENQKF
jgi:hypothetical protein